MLKSKFVILILAIVLIMGVVFNQPISKAAPGDWTLVWSDEFTGPDGSAVDASKWRFGGQTYMDSEVTYYSNTTANSYLQNNMCVIKAMKQINGGYNYSSAKINTMGKFNFTYGKVEMSAKLPYGDPSIFPDFWLVGSNMVTAGWPACGEIDIMVNFNVPGTIQGTLFGPGYSDGAIYATYTLPGGALFRDGFHLFTVEWEPNVIRWYCDGVLYQTRTPADLGSNPWVFDHDFYINIEMLVGGSWLGTPGPNAVFPQYYTIDYVRVYQRQGGYSTPTPTPTVTPVALKIEAENYSAMSGVQTETCSEGGRNVGWIDTGDWMDYNVNIPRGGIYQLDYRIASPNATGKVDLKVGAATLATTAIPNTGGWQAWKTVSSQTVSLYSGLQTIRLSASGGGWNINWFSLNELIPSPTPTIPPTITPQPSTVTPTPLPTPTPWPTPTHSPGPLLSLGKPATASSFQAGNEVAKGNDGNSGTRWAAANGNFPQWWMVDLGASYNLAEVDIEWYNYSTRSYKYKIEVSTDNITFITVVDKTANTNLGATFDGFTAAGRYVRITITGTSAGWASANEFKVFKNGP
jgi:beta-glucanase (GH16 family)